MDIISNFEAQAQTASPGVAADAIIDFLDANWSAYTSAERAVLIEKAETFHLEAAGQWLD